MTNKLEVRNLSKQFISPGGPFSKARAMHAVNDVSFDLPTGRVIGVVGESGCGKSTLARLILRLIEPTTGSLSFDGDDLLAQPPAAMRRLRADMQMVFQDPYSAIDPRFTVGRAVMEPFEVQGRKPAGTHAEEIDRLLTMVGLNPGLANSFPHQISGGQKQRVGIARALALRPSLLVLDEPTASLDVSVQAQIISLLEELRDDLGLTYLFISHDLSLVRYFCDEILVMYLGRVVEALPDTSLPARHPYTKTLMDSTFAPDPKQRRVIAPLEGEVPSPFDLPPGCAFAERCPHATDICRRETPTLAKIDGHAVACHHPL
ncbi:ATP-binding cassette domain-containing protein [Sulfitobacter mediterraneus]|jgi:oligopeptide/dipeptide ABC transporter ATP-binding protein|uniref:ABC transporter ATP-binding protein n=1 Tax=Sulfitobacter mediterraneus TaxID=83219 RepID=UPI0019323421|nr:oligopeptide/dipeptide ABC transporter ATP-binding protein [Sulfitobacter mediterraneus]MBM1635161.1 ATP-binding cassette domain-containing protein [Sulfitobacter mediterraneus]MBM1642985.1 ATP-binding cassette domain-containing protein [Sulfitobacter mediterraneus]MBM1647033.1 ATP-binding cassette domain-containing protein [Sulfitobacter mediterraneus]MBM1651075.1 ATP-binding cassette domain-containing protein [Sulfitobacter mediterraneus]MBM1655024.1 ATP-binding cassette domain-containing